jgi:hypothetical protein
MMSEPATSIATTIFESPDPLLQTLLQSDAKQRASVCKITKGFKDNDPESAEPLREPSVVGRRRRDITGRQGQNNAEHRVRLGELEYRVPYCGKDP